MIKTTAMFSAHTIHVLHVILRDTIIFLVVLCLALFAWLKYGIHVDKLVLGKHEIHGLYIKLDKKLTLKADKIMLPETKEKESFDNIDETFDKIKNLFTYFDYIELAELNFKNNKFQFIYTSNILYINSRNYEIAGNIKRIGKTLTADVTMFNIREYNASIRGKFKYYLDKDRLETEGSFEALNISGHFAAFKADKELSFAINSGEFYDLKTLTDILPVNDVLKLWIAHNVEGKKYLLHSFVGKAQIDKNGLKMDFDSLRGNATVSDVFIKYHQNLDPVLAKELSITYKKQALYFDLKKPVYKGRDLNGSRVSILNIGKNKNVMLHVDLHVKSPIDKVVHNILKEYNLNIPFEQKKAFSIADINLTIPLGRRGKSPKKVGVIVDIVLPSSDISVNKVASLPVKGGEVHYKDGVVTLKNIKLKDKAYVGNVNGKVNIKAKKADMTFKVDKLQFSDAKKTYFDLKNKDLKIKLDYDKHTVDIPLLDIKISRIKKKFTLNLLNLNTLKPYIKKMPVNIDGGHLVIKTDDFKTYDFSGLLKRNSCFFYDKGVCHTSIKCNGKISKKEFIFSAFNKRLYIDMTKSRIDVNNLNIDLKALFKSKNEEIKGPNTATKKRVTIRGKNSKLRYEEYILLTDNYKIDVASNGNINAVGTLGTDKVTFNKKGEYISISALRVQDRLLHPLINFSGLKKGRYTFKSQGIPMKNIKGEIVIEGGVMSGFKAYNNTLAFINTLPALATLHNPGYSDEGFHIKKGIAKYRKIGDKIYFDSIHIEGKSASIVGKGLVDLKKNTINMNMAIQTAREFGKVVGSIPVLGYILMGEDKSMTVGLTITGSLSKPIVKTSATKELLQLPLDLIKRTFKSPAHITNKKQKEKVKKIVKEKPKIKRPSLFNKVTP